MKCIINTGDGARTVVVTHADRIRAELAANSRGWPLATEAPTAAVTMAAYHADRRLRPEDTPTNFDSWLESVVEFEIVPPEDSDAHPTNAAP